MSAASWVRIDGEIFDDLKVDALAQSCGASIAATVGHLVGVLVKMGRHATDGDLSAVSDSLLERWAYWDGDAGTFASAFRATMLDDAGVWVAWSAHNGKAIDRATVEAERQRVRRAEWRAKLDAARAKGDGTHDEPPSSNGPSADARDNVRDASDDATDPRTQDVRRTQPVRDGGRTPDVLWDGTERNGTERTDLKTEQIQQQQPREAVSSGDMRERVARETPTHSPAPPAPPSVGPLLAAFRRRIPEGPYPGIDARIRATIASRTDDMVGVLTAELDGMNGRPPTPPELLDRACRELAVAEGWTFSARALGFFVEALVNDEPVPDVATFRRRRATTTSRESTTEATVAHFAAGGA